MLVIAGCSGSATTKNSMSEYSWSDLSKIATEIHDAANDAEGLEIATSYNLLNSSGKLDTSTKGVTLSDGTVAQRKYIDFKINTDERICDGFDYAQGFKLFKMYIRQPELLENPPERVVEDVF